MNMDYTGGVLWAYTVGRTFVTKEALANALNGFSYPFDLPKQLVQAAYDAGLVVVFGASDDPMEFRGAIADELEAYGGTTVLMTADGIFENDTCHSQCRYFAQAKALAQQQGKTIEACCEQEGYSWIYLTTIPHVTFDIIEDGEKYCRGIVFVLADVER